MNDRIEYLVELGRRIKTSEEMRESMATAGHKNAWFAPGFVQYAMDAVSHEMLNEQKLKQWLEVKELYAVELKFSN